MNWFADESVDRSIVDRLRSDGHSVASVAELDPSISDDEVLRRATDQEAVLITADKDFGELVFRQNRVHTGVLLIRLAGKSTAEKAVIIATVVRDHGPELIGAFSVATADNVRIRRASKSGCTTEIALGGF